MDEKVPWWILVRHWDCSLAILFPASIRRIIKITFPSWPIYALALCLLFMWYIYEGSVGGRTNGSIFEMHGRVFYCCSPSILYFYITWKILILYLAFSLTKVKLEMYAGDLVGRGAAGIPVWRSWWNQCAHIALWEILLYVNLDGREERMVGMLKPMASWANIKAIRWRRVLSHFHSQRTPYTHPRGLSLGDRGIYSFSQKGCRKRMMCNKGNCIYSNCIFISMSSTR